MHELTFLDWQSKLDSSEAGSFVQRGATPSSTVDTRSKMNPRFFSCLPSLFHGSVLSQLADFGRSALIDDLLVNADVWNWFRPGQPLAAIFNQAYDILRREYRCEYLFKNALAHKLVLGRHSLRTAMLIPELRVDACRADIVIVNGTSTVYEVKSGLDNLDRLESQLAAYRLAFDKICVVTEENNERQITAAVEDDVGILVLTSRYRLRLVREPGSNASRVSPAAIFDSLREGESMRIIKDEFGHCPDVPNGIRYTVCKDLFVQLSPEQAHNGMVRELRRRAGNPGFSEFMDKLPLSLKAAGFGVSLTKARRARLLDALASDYPLYSRYELSHQF